MILVSRGVSLLHFAQRGLSSPAILDDEPLPLFYFGLFDTRILPVSFSLSHYVSMALWKYFFRGRLSPPPPLLCILLPLSSRFHLENDPSERVRTSPTCGNSSFSPTPRPPSRLQMPAPCSQQRVFLPRATVTPFPSSPSIPLPFPRFFFTTTSNPFPYCRE